MLLALRRLARRLGGRSLERSDHVDDGVRRVENPEGLSAAQTQHGNPYAPGGAPPNWVRPTDEGRPRK